MMPPFQCLLIGGYILQRAYKNQKSLIRNPGLKYLFIAISTRRSSISFLQERKNSDSVGLVMALAYEIKAINFKEKK
jgi:hypothetical protein